MKDSLQAAKWLFKTVIAIAFGWNTAIAQDVNQALPRHLNRCVTDSGGEYIVEECFRAENGNLYLIRKDFLAVSEAPIEFQEMIASVCDVMKISSEGCEIAPMFVPIEANAIAGECDGKKVVLFDPNITAYFGQAGTKFAISHEIGHHYCGHVGGYCTPESELEADTFAGASLRRLGVSLKETLEILNVLGGPASPLYPDKNARSFAIRKGWTNPKVAEGCRSSASGR